MAESLGMRLLMAESMGMKLLMAESLGMRLLLWFMLYVLEPASVPNRYNDKLKEARELGGKKGAFVGISFGFLFFLLFIVDAAAFW